MKENRKIYLIFILALISNFVKAQENYTNEKQISSAQNYIFTHFETVNKTDNVTLKGTLIEPKKTYSKVVIIVPGSGKDTRNSHYKLTEKLLENNIAVYRFDERGCGNSTGNFNTYYYNINDKDYAYLCYICKDKIKNNDFYNKFFFDNLEKEHNNISEKQINILNKIKQMCNT
jgi:cephalosporin-C deacetylase-like acetyl esterase